ncbi:MAG: Gfo/Idh/MocA family oxidoreductase [Candidatus Omnitrophica bacterium]|nr:Gfo/Idh/MocA family oxidoreductase [Candidatus Omnitrophota bacterium]
MKKLNVGVVGIGQLGQHHARIYHELPEVNLVGLCDIHKEKEAKAKEYGTVFFKNYHDLLGKVDAVSIATPTHLHACIAKTFLEHNIHVLIEKPITNNLQEADDLIALATKKNCFLRVGHIERHNAGFKAVKKIAKKIKFIEIHRLGPFTPRVADCGVVLDLMIHDLDIILTLLQSNVTYLDAVGICVLSRHEDIANARLKFENGAIANITASRLTAEKQRKIRIFQDDAYISLDYQNQQVLIHRKELFNISKKEIDIKKEEPLRCELQEFVRDIREGKSQTPVDIDARNALAIALRILESIKENQKHLKG